jgi:hypothetical protein
MKTLRIVAAVPFLAVGVLFLVVGVGLTAFAKLIDWE